MTFDISAAKDAGYSEQEIVDFLSNRNPNFDINNAREAGYSLVDIANFLAKTEQTQPQEQMAQDTQPKESLSTTALRYLYQPVAGAAAMTPASYIPAIANLLGRGIARDFLSEIGAGDEMFIPELAEEKRAEMEAMIPTQENLERMLEERFGLPLTPQTRGQRLARLGGEGFKAVGKLGLSAPLFSETYRQAGVPEPVANVMGLLSSGLPVAELPEKSPRQLGENVKNVVEPETPLVRQETPTGEPALPPPTEIRGRLPKVGEKPARFKSMEDLLEEAQKTLEETPLNVEKPPFLDLARISIKGVSPTKLRPQTQKQDIPEALIKPRETIGKIIYKEEFPNDVIGGQQVRQKINEVASNEWKNVNKLYAEQRKLYGNTEIIAPELADQLETVINELEKIPKGDLSTISKNILNKAKSTRKSLVEADPITGEIAGYKPIELQTLSNIIKEINTGAKYDFQQAVPTRKYNQLLNPFKETLEKYSKVYGKEDAFNKLQEANTAHMQWKQTFEDPAILPFRNARKADELPELFQSTEKFATIKNIENILGEKFPDITSKLQRNYIVNKIDPYFKNPKNIGNEEYTRTISELKTTFPKLEERISKIDSRLRSQKPSFTAQKREPTQTAKKLAQTLQRNKVEAAKTLDFTPQRIEKLLQSRRGLRELREQLSEKNQTELFEKLADARGQQILRQGEVVPRKMTGNELYKILNKDKNFEQLAEIYGEEAVEKALEEAAKAKKAEDVNNVIIELGKFVGKIAGLGKLVRAINIVT